MQGNLGESVVSILSTTGLEPELLEVELTESLLIHNASSCVSTIDSLRTLGVSIVINNFGTGYSSLGYLKQFLFDTIKSDHSFISNITNDSTDVAIASAVIRLSMDLDINGVAEGVENRRQMDYLCQQKTSGIQGYLISTPLSAKSYSNLFHSLKEGKNNY